MTSTPIYDQLVRELGEQRSPLARAHNCIGEVIDALAKIGIGYPRRPSEATYRERRAAWHAFCGPLPAPLVLDEPIYDGLVNEMGYPHCSPVEALVTYTDGRSEWQLLRKMLAWNNPYLPPITVRRWMP